MVMQSIPIPITSLAHAALTDVTWDQHHVETHTVVSHDTDATGAELDTLTDGSDSDALHTHAFSRWTSGSFTGDGSTSLVVSGLGDFTPLWVKIWDVNTVDQSNFDDWIPSETTPEMMDDVAAKAGVGFRTGSNTFQMRESMIIAFANGQFTVDDDGLNAAPNASGVVYNFIAGGNP